MNAPLPSNQRMDQSGRGRRLSQAGTNRRRSLDDLISVVAASTNSVIATVSVDRFPSAVAITPNGAFVYVAHEGVNDVHVIQTSTNTVVATIPLISGSYDVVITPDGSQAYVIGSCLASVIETATNTVTTTFALPCNDGNAHGVDITPDGAFLYVVMGNGDVSGIQTSTNTVTATIDGGFAYVANFDSDDVSVIQISTNTVVATIPVGSDPLAVAIAAVPSPVLSVPIDIKPGSNPAVITLRGNGRIPVAILSTPSFDAPATVVTSSLTFGRTGDERSLASCSAAAQDLNGDGRLDLLCQFFTQPTAFQVGDTEGILLGTTFGGQRIEGRDAVRVRP
jgi:YVTN family beta-propeller protein